MDRRYHARGWLRLGFRRARSEVLGIEGDRYIEPRRDGLLRGTVEEGVQQLSQRRLPRSLARNGRHEHVAGAVLLMTEMAFFLEHAQERAHGGITRRIRELIEHLGGGGTAGPVDHVHDLPFPTAQLRVRFFGHCRSPNGWMLKN